MRLNSGTWKYADTFFKNFREGILFPFSTRLRNDWEHLSSLASFF